MTQLHMEHLPKVLQMALTELCGEQHLINWNINSNGNITSLHMKFAMPGHIVQVTPVPQSGKRKPPGQ